MENGVHMNASGTLDNLVKFSPDENEQTRSNDDIMARRMKNRERQRRYRERKRLQADIRKPCIINQATLPKVEEQLNDRKTNNSVTCVHSTRNWKKDARRAHTFNDQEDTPNVSVVPTCTLSNGRVIPCWPSGFNADEQLEREFPTENSLSLVSYDTNRSILGGRKWKAEARNKKD